MVRCDYYAGLALATGFSFLSIMGSEAQRHAIARRGAIYGGLILLVMMLLVNVGVLSIMPTANEVPLPAMEMADNMAPARRSLLNYYYSFDL